MVDDETLFRDDGGRLADRRARDGARRERRRDRRARAAGARGRQHRAALPRADASARGRGRGDEPRDPARRTSPARRSTSSTSRAARRSSRSRAPARQGWDVWGETCTQYFFNSLDDIAKPNFEGAKYVYSPPVRDKSNQDVLWNARADRRALGDLHRPLRLPLRRRRRRSARTTSRRSRTAAPASRTGCSMIHEFGVRAGRISLNRMVELLRHDAGQALRPLPARRARSRSAPTPTS